MFEQIIIVLMGILFLIVLPIMSTIKYWNYKPYIKYALSLIWISYIVIFYEVFFPRDSYYINNLKSFSNIEFTNETKILNSYTSFLNIKGEYSSCAIFEVTNNEKNILKNLKKDKMISLPDFNDHCTKIIKEQFKNDKLITFKSIDEKNLKQWGFLKDSNKIFIYHKYFGMTNK
ncbi:hypothetical protein [Arcobacter sp.]|uniref:hypothetical protein n=1 Tax=Arcobacter sp. TaxID=1872629 RepID=UPI003D1423A4